jgi:hypothetical protein
MPVHESKEHAVFFFPQAPGRSLHEMLLSHEWPDLMSLVKGIRRLGGIELKDPLKVHDFEAERAATLKMLDRGIVLVPELEPFRRRIAEMDLPACSPTRFVHRDLHDKQIFVHQGKVHFIDFEGAVRGAPYWDAVNLAEHGRLRSLQNRTPYGERLAAALLDHLGIDPHALEVKLLAGLTRARLAGVYAMRPRWKDLSLELAASAIEKLGDVT